MLLKVARLIQFARHMVRATLREGGGGGGGGVEININLNITLPHPPSLPYLSKCMQLIVTVLNACCSSKLALEFVLTH